LGLSKQLAEQLLGLYLPFFSQGDGLVLADGIADVAFLMQAIQGIPIVALPGRRAKLVVAPRQVEQSKNRLVYLVRVEVHFRSSDAWFSCLEFRNAANVRREGPEVTSASPTALVECTYQPNPATVQPRNRLPSANSGFMPEPNGPMCCPNVSRRGVNGMVSTLTNVETNDSNGVTVESIRRRKQISNGHR
jgi:hypothetical protein